MSGNLTVRTGSREEIAGPMDTLYIPAGEEREIRNEGNDVVTIIVAMPYPEGATVGGGS